MIIDTATDRIVGRVPVPQPHNSAISPDGRTAYVGSQQQGATGLVILDLVNNVEIGRACPLKRRPARSILARTASRSTSQWPGQTPCRCSTQRPTDRARDPRGSIAPLSVSSRPTENRPGRQPGSWESRDFRPSSNTRSASITVGKLPHWIAISSDGRTAYVTDEGSNDVSVVDLGSQKVTATIPVGNAPRKIAVQPGPTTAMTAFAPAVATSAEQSRESTGN